MFKRILTSVIGIPLVILIMMLGNPLLQIMGCIIALIGVYEFYDVIKKQYQPITWVGYVVTVVFFLNYRSVINNFAIFISIVIMLLLVLMVFTYPKYTIIDVALSLFAPLYVGLLISFIILLREAEYGSFFVWLVFISAWGSDTCAYFTGSLIGKHKLAPILSPKKTIEGAIGGAIGAGCLAILYTYIYTNFAIEPMRDKIWLIGGIVVVSAIFSQIGDLAASAIKRTLGVKDFGYIFPGHGGVLDRFDSILFVAPFIVIALQFISEFKIIG